MGTSKNTSGDLFNEFLNEEALKPRQQVEVALEIVKPETISYRLAVPKPATAEEIKTRWRDIRNFFRSGDIPQGSEALDLVPVLLAPFLKSEALTTDYPVFLSTDHAFPHGPFSDLLDLTFRKIFKEKEAVILADTLPRIKSFATKYVAEAGHFCALDKMLDAAFQDLATIKIKGEDQAAFLRDIEKFRGQLPSDGNLLGFSGEGAIHLLVHLLKYQSLEQRKKFISRMHALKSGLHDLLSVENAGHSREKSSGWGIADSLIEFNKLDTLRPERASVSMPEKRYKRIDACISTLDSADDLLLKYDGLIFIGHGVHAHFNNDWNALLAGLEVRVAPAHESCLTASNGFKEHIAGLTKLIAAARMAELEIKNRYDEEIHGDFFNRFNWHYFTEEEMSLCPPAVLIEESQNLLGKELPHFSSLMASNIPVKVLALNRPVPFEINANGSNEDWPSYQQELSSLTISHRSAFTLQGALHNPVHLVKGFETGLASTTPALFNILIPADEQHTNAENFIRISSAVEGRQFPLFSYTVSGEKWGSRFDINANPQADRNWPVYAMDITNFNNEIEQLELAFTFGDVYALNPSGNKHLFLVPPSCWTDDLVPLSTYLELPADQLYSRVPFIWLVDQHNTLQKVAVPYALVIAAKERLDFWNFIQEEGGVNSFHVEQAVARTRAEMQEQKEKEISKLEERFNEELEIVRSTAAGEAMERLAGILLDLDSITPLPAVAGASRSSASPQVKEEKPAEEAPAKVEAAAKPAEISSEPWVETYRCTSCNECTDKYPRAFKYNGDKQAYVEDATTVTFAQLVKAAEACPAKCIHPGLPLNPNEPGLQELLVKAKSFN